MAKKPATTRTTPKAPSKKPAPVVSSPVRNSSIPKAQPVAAAPKAVTHDMIARRAYEISQSPQCGSEYDNWIRAERELKGL